MSEFSGLVAVVTGAASGIGAAIAERLTEDGATVFAFDLGFPDGGKSPHRAIVDVRDQSTVDAGVAACVAQCGGIDIVVNNAGIGATGTIEDHEDADWMRVLDVNLLGAVRVTRAALPYLRRSSAASVVNMSSIAATAGLPGRALYGASKGAIHALTLHMAADYARAGIRVNAVAPGTVDTPWVERLVSANEDADAARAALRGRQPHGRLVTASEVASAVAYLASPRSASATASIVTMDGGMSGVRVPTSST